MERPTHRARLRFVPLGVSLALCGCAESGVTEPRYLTADGLVGVSWTTQELDKEIAVRTLKVTESASYHVVRLRGDEKPHTHQKSDLTVTVLSGKVRMNLGSQVVTALPGQVIDIPRGTFHFAENLSDDVSEAYVVFSPPLEKGDNVPAARPGE